VARQEVAHIAPEAAEADLFFQAQGAGLTQEVFPARPLVEDMEGEGPSGPPGAATPTRILCRHTICADLLRSSACPVI
jgi:hypothetical protein